MLTRSLIPLLAVGAILTGVGTADAADYFFRYRGMMPTQIAAVEPGESEAPAEPTDDYKNAFSLGATWGGGVPVVVDVTLPYGIEAKGPITVNADPDADRIPASDLPASNTPFSTYSSHRTVEARDADGNPMTLDLFVAVSGTGAIQIAFFDAAKAADPEYFFPYSSGPLAAPDVLF
jgi:hypothetical protein